MFKAPLGIPQDLLLIQSLVGVDVNALQTKPPLNPPQDENIDSSGSEADSEDEIEAELVVKTEQSEEHALPLDQVPQTTPSSALSSDSSDSDSDSDSHSSDDTPAKTPDEAGRKVDEEEMMDEEDSGPSAGTSSYYLTKNEIADATISVPDIEEVGPEEHLELVGEIMNIIDNVVIVKGVQAELARRDSDRALDSETLLVFEDRKVLGYVYETFGPTTQPMYQVKFNPTTYPLDLEKVQLSRKVYHVPHRSHFVFMQQIRFMKGSDASNMNDEEPADHELEFSDDEAEAEYKKSLKKKRASSRASSAVPSSRQATPTPSQMRDSEMANDDYFMTNNAYDEIGPYDTDFGTSFSRPAPIPYDDPYSDEFNGASSSSSSSTGATVSQSPSSGAAALRPQRRSANRDAGRRDDGPRGRGRGRGNSNRGNNNRRGGARGGYNSFRSGDDHQAWSHGSNASSYSGSGVPPSPTSTQQQPYFPQQSVSQMGQWPVQMQAQGMQGFGAAMSYDPHSQQQQPFIQPHINPRFAGQFGGQFGMNGMDMSMAGAGAGGGNPYAMGMPAMNMQSQPMSQGYTGMFTPTDAPSHWSDQWSVQMQGNGGGGDSSANENHG